VLTLFVDVELLKELIVIEEVERVDDIVPQIYENGENFRQIYENVSNYVLKIEFTVITSASLKKLVGQRGKMTCEKKYTGFTQIGRAVTVLRYTVSRGIPRYTSYLP
jgi:hypothetical protein